MILGSPLEFIYLFQFVAKKILEELAWRKNICDNLVLLIFCFYFSCWLIFSYIF